MLRFLWDSISLQMLFVFLLVFLLVSDYMKRRKPKDFPPKSFFLPFPQILLSKYDQCVVTPQQSSWA